MSLRQKAGFLHADADLVERIGVYHDLRSIYAQEKVQKQKVARIVRYNYNARPGTSCFSASAHYAPC